MHKTIRVFALFGPTLAMLVGAPLLRAYAAPQPAFQVAPSAPDGTPRTTAVGSRSGDYTYSYPINLPPGRLGAQPKLALSYTSSAPVHGSSLGQGWALSGVPVIQVDTRQTSLGNDTHYVSELAGGQRLHPVVDGLLAADAVQAYRAQYDDTFARYEKLGVASKYEWRVQRADGTTLYFGDRTPAPLGTSGPVHLIAPLARTEDRFGNAVGYNHRWSTMPTHTVEDAQNITRQTDAAYYELLEIRYGENKRAGLGHHALIRFLYNQTIPLHCDKHSVTIGSTVSYRSGTLLASGVNTLSTILTYVRDDDSARPLGTYGLRRVRQYDLAHDEQLANCRTFHSPRRVLRSITATAWAQDGTATTRPPTRFDYGVVDTRYFKSFDRAISSVALESAWGPNVTRAGIFDITIRPDSLVHSKLVDMNGDGKPDRIVLAPQPTNGECTARWYENVGDAFVFRRSFSLPSLRWKGTERDSEREYCSLEGQATNYQPLIDNGGADDCPTGNTWPSRLSYGWEDINDDGVVDLIVGYYRNPTKVGWSLSAPFVNVSVPPTNEWDFWSSDYDRSWATTINAEFAAEGECGLRAETVGAGYQWYVFVNDGHGNLAVTPHIRWQPLPYRVPAAVNPKMQDFDPNRYNMNQVGFVDYDGDGYKDAVFHYSGLDDPTLYGLQLFLGDRDGFFHGHPVTGRAFEVEDYASKDLEPTYAWCERCDNAPPQDQYKCGMVTCTYCFPGRCTLEEFLVPRPPGIMGAHQGNPSFYTAHATRIENQGYPDFDEWPWSFSFTRAHIDVNADGLPDWIGTAGELRLNTSAGIEPPTTTWLDLLTDSRDLFPYGEPYHQWDMLAGSRENRVLTYTTPIGPGTQQLGYGRSFESMAWVDYDHDGFLDKLYIYYVDEFLWNAPGPSPLPGYAPVNVRVAYSMGGVGFLAPIPVQEDKERVFAVAAVSGHWGTDTHGFHQWREQEGAIIDIDGDGFRDAVYRAVDGTYRAKSMDYGTSPPGLLIRVVEPNDDETHIEYTATNNAAVVTTDPTRRRVMPQAKFVVQSIVKHYSPMMWSPGSMPALPSVFTYRYFNPMWNRDDIDKRGFRGFEQVHTTAPAGSIVVDTFDYELDYRGLPVESMVFPSASALAANTPHSIEATEWTELYLSNLGLTTFHPATQNQWACEVESGSLDYATCKMSGVSHATTTTWNSLAALAANVSPPLIWVANLAETTVAPDPLQTRQVETDYVLYTGENAYHVQPYRVTARARDDGTQGSVFEVVGQTDTDFDTTFRVPVATATSVDGTGTFATVKKGYDMATGHTLWQAKPRQVADCEKATWCTIPKHESYAYDDLGVFVATTTNEAGHQVGTTHDPGNGILIETRGPNSTTDLQGNIIVNKRVTGIDGFGRTLYHQVSVDDLILGSVLKTTLRTTYDDDPFFAGTRTTTEKWIDFGGRSVITETLTDSAGRVTQVTTGGAVSKFAYDESGNLMWTMVSDPSRDVTTSLVVYTTTYDSLGRVKTLLRPDGTGVSFVYHGLSRVVTEVPTNTGSGAGAQKILVDDAFGRLATVIEVGLGNGETSAYTNYEYDANDNLNQVTNADGE